MPVQLYEWLLMNYAKEGDKILDTHLGSGSIAIACHNLGFDLTACELDKEYYEKAMKRIQEHKNQIRMF
jgi:site-specific DNA-methyltransferase (adenine-specific)